MTARDIRIRGGRGLGDSIYLRPIVEYFLRQGHTVTVHSDYPGAFEGVAVEVKPFTRDGINVLAHYTTGKANAATHQFADMCRSANVPVMPLSFDWKLRDTPLVAMIHAKAQGRRIIVVHGGRAPMARTDGFGAELLPKKEAFDTALAELRDCFIVKIGKAEEIYSLDCELDLNGKTTVQDLFDIAAIAHGFLAQCSYCIPLAEAFDKPLMIVFAAAGFVAPSLFVRQITPTKVLSKTTSFHVVDEWPAAMIEEAARALR